MEEMFLPAAESELPFELPEILGQRSRGIGCGRGTPMNQKMVGVVPTLKRPEMLALCLEKLSQTHQASSLDVRIFLDHSNDPKLNAARLADTEYVRDTYFPTAEIFHANN